MKKLFAIGVHSSIRMEKNEYFFIYKNIEFKFVPSHNNDWTDCLIGKFDAVTNDDVCYSLITEFLSAFVISTDGRVIPEPGLITQLPSFSLKNLKNCFSSRRLIPSDENMDEFYHIVPIETPEQAIIARLYRQARAANNLYLEILFFWHCLVFPSTNDLTAVAFVDKLVSSLPPELSHLQENISRIKKSLIFLPKSGGQKTLGKYFLEGVRNSIGHIIRNQQDSRNLNLDLLSEERHLSDVAFVLRYFSKYRLKIDFSLDRCIDQKPEIFDYFHPE